MTWWLRVSYDLPENNQPYTDALVFGVLGDRCDSGAGFGQRDLEFAFDSETAALDAEQKLKSAELPLVFATDIYKGVS